MTIYVKTFNFNDNKEIYWLYSKKIDEMFDKFYWVTRVMVRCWWIYKKLI